MEMMVREKGNERIRVLRISHSSLTPALRERERALVRCFSNIDLEVLTTEHWREAGVDIPAQADDLFPVRTASSYWSKHSQLLAYDPRPLARALREHRPHLIDMNHEPSSVSCAEILSLVSLVAPKTPIVVQTAQNIQRSCPPPFSWLEQRAFRRISAAYVCTEAARNVLLAKGFRKPVEVVPFGADLSAFKPGQRQRSGQPPTIGFVSKMSPGEGVDVLAAALGKIWQKSWRLLVVGDGPDRADFIERLAKSGVVDRAEFTGAISYEQIPNYFQQMDMLVVPTRTADPIQGPFGRVIVEAMASGVTVIGSTSGAIPEIIGDAGIVVPEGDTTALSLALTHLLTDEKSRERFSREGRNRVEENYSWDSVAKKTYELFQEVLRNTRKTNGNSRLELAA